jgi:hypothetical protein
VDTALLDLVEAVDRPRQLSLQGPAIVELLFELRRPQGLLIENLVADVPSPRQAGGGKLHPQFRHPVGRRRHGVSGRGDLVGDLLLLEALHHRPGVLAGKPGIDHPVIHLVGPEDEPDNESDGQQTRRQQGHPPSRREGRQILLKGGKNG